VNKIANFLNLLKKLCITYQKELRWLGEVKKALQRAIFEAKGGKTSIFSWEGGARSVKN